jgi:hypothetical protein
VEVSSPSEARWGGADGGTVVATGWLGAGGGEWSLGHSARGRKAPNFTGERVMVRRRGERWPATIASMPIMGEGEGIDELGPRTREGAVTRE